MDLGFDAEPAVGAGRGADCWAGSHFRCPSLGWGYSLRSLTVAASMRRPSPVKYRADFSHRGFTRGR